MTRLISIVTGIALVLMPLAAFAGIAGSDHDLTSWAGPGSAKDLCQACHIPHNAGTGGSGGFLWSSTPSGAFSGVADLCFTCHDGSVTDIGSTTAFNTGATIEQHKNVGSDCSADDGCHDVHNQNPVLGGKFLVPLASAETNGSYCETCHDVSQFLGAELLGDHTAGITHYTNGGTFTCNQCHTLHGATKQTTNPGTLDNPILLADNSNGYYGSFCVTCHNGTAPAEASPGTGGQTVTDAAFDYSESTADGSEIKHPTTSAAMTGGCGHCHDVHDPTGTAYGYLLLEDNTESAYCTSCHKTGDGTTVGLNTHFVDAVPSVPAMNNSLTPPLPWANQIDDDGTNTGAPGADWTATPDMMVCETCHSVHRKGALNGGPLLRDANTADNEICTACHTAN